MTALDAGTVSIGAALVAGLAGSGHCIGMCGGIAGALAMRGSAAAGGPPSFSSRLAAALAYNLSRVASYALAGAIAGLLGRTLLRAVDVAPLSIALRVVAGLIMAAAAGRLLFGWRLLDPIERAGSGVWRRVAPMANRGRRREGLGGAVTLGLAWGWLPCGLTYSMLLLAATSASVATGAAVMAAFGLGTLPAMVSATVAFERAARVLAGRATLRQVAGVLLLAFGAWTAGSAVRHGVMHGDHGAHVHDMAGSPVPMDHSQMGHSATGPTPTQSATVDHSHMDHASMDEAPPAQDVAESAPVADR